MSTKKKDNRKKVDIDLSDERFLTLAKEAHEKDITLNQLIENKLREYLKKIDLK